VLPQARRFNELGVEGTAAGLEGLAPVDTATRTLELEFPALPRVGEEESRPDA